MRIKKVFVEDAFGRPKEAPKLVHKGFSDFMVMKNVFDARLCKGIRSCAIHKFYGLKAARLKEKGMVV